MNHRIFKPFESGGVALRLALVGALSLGAMLVSACGDDTNPNSTGAGGSGSTGSGLTTGTTGSGKTTGTGMVADDAAELSWDPPTTNADGSPLTDLAGYRVYYGTSPNSYDQNLDAGDAVIFVVEKLDPGTYYFAVTAYDSSGNESIFSEEVSKTIE